MTSPELKVSVAGVAIRRYRSLDEFRSHVESLAAQTADAGRSLLLLPELLCVGLLWTDPDAAAITSTVVKKLYQRTLNPLFSAYCESISTVAQRHGLIIAGASIWHERDGRAVNTALWCRPDGVIEYQDKLHPTRPERAIDTVGGDSVTLFSVEGVKVGMIVCYDVQFPELVRSLVDAGARVILVPSLTDARGYWRVRHCAQARAIENQIFTCVAPLVGNLGVPSDRSPDRRGRPLVACPIDNRFDIEDGVLVQGDMDVENIVHASLDVGLLELSRTKSEITQMADRRPELYARSIVSG